MNKYKQQGKGRNHSEKPKMGVSGLARTLLARNDPTVAFLPEQDAPHTQEPPRSLREQRRHHGGTLTIPPIDKDRMLGTARREFQTEPQRMADSVSAMYAHLREVVHNMPPLRMRIGGAVHDSMYVSPTGRLFNGHNRMLALAAMYGAGGAAAQAIRQGIERETAEVRDRIIRRRDGGAMTMAGTDERCPEWMLQQAREQRERTPGVFRLTYNGRPVNIDTGEFMVEPRRHPRGLFESLTLGDRRVRFLPVAYPDTERSADPISEAFGMLFESEARRKEREKAEEEAKIKERLGERKPGDVVRRPRRSLLGIPVIDEIQEDGQIARKVVQPQEKENGSDAY